MSFPRYPKYKASGVEWLGEVPEHWEVKKLRHFAEVLRGKFTHRPRNDPAFYEGAFPFVQTGDITGTSRYITEFKQTLNDRGIAVSKEFPKGTLVMAIAANIGDVAILDFPAYFPDSIVGLVPQGDVYLMFLYYLMIGMKQPMLMAATVSTQMNLNVDQICSLAGACPPLTEQTNIVAFLDRETAKIDGLVAEQRRLMELLKEKRQADISHAVTKGLNPHAPMKPSGIEWLGEVPKHWEVSKMKWVAEMQSGHTPDKKVPAYWENGDIPWVSLNDTGFLKDNDYISETAYSITQLGIENSSARLLPPRVVVFSRDATIGRCAITTRPMAVSQHFIAWVCDETMIPEFLLLRLRSMTQELDRLTTGATLKTIGMPDVRTITTPVPPLEEQLAIINWVSTETANLDTLTAEAQRAIDLLQERRTALISAAVTGQIDIRGVA